jgi:hypothetical protein
VLINIEFGLLLRIEVHIYFHLQIRLNFQLSPTEPANYTGSYTTGAKEIVDIEIAMYQSAGTLITDTLTIAARRTVTTAMQMLWLLKLTVSQEQVGGLRN